jgi:hypothetical protein
MACPFLRRCTPQLSALFLRATLPPIPRSRDRRGALLLSIGAAFWGQACTVLSTRSPTTRTITAAMAPQMISMRLLAYRLRLDDVGT